MQAGLGEGQVVRQAEVWYRVVRQVEGELEEGKRDYQRDREFKQDLAIELV